MSQAMMTKETYQAKILLAFELGKAEREANGTILTKTQFKNRNAFGYAPDVQEDMYRAYRVGFNHNPVFDKIAGMFHGSH